MERANEVLEFWFGRGPWDAARLAERSHFWFGGGDDALVRSTLEPMLERAAHGEFAAWSASPKRRLALILLFDQVPRSAYRDTAAAFAFDREALALSLEGMQLAADAALEPVERLFFYLPLEHAESMEAQDTAVAALERLLAEAPAELKGAAEGWLGYARKHREVISKFGRFPYRNRVLDRESTPAEVEWLAGESDHFGQ